MTSTTTKSARPAAIRSVSARLKQSAATLGAAFALLLAPLSPAIGETASPAIWRLADHDTSIYLFGTVHLLPQNYQWRTSRFDAIAAKADTLVVETVIDEKNPQGFAAELARLAMSPGLPPIVERVPPEKRAALRAAIAKSGIPEVALNNMDTWAAAFALLQLQFQDLGLSGASGVESNLKGTFTAAGKPVEQLETNAEQLGFFDTLPEAAQREFLVSALDEPANVRKQFDGMLKAWSTGDVEEIGDTFNEEFEASPDLKAALLDKRNANWAAWLKRRLDKPGTVLVAVGAGHLAGDDNVIELLQEKGLKVERVQ